MPRRTWRAAAPDVLARHFTTYPCPDTCQTRKRLTDLFGVSTIDLDNEIRTDNRRVALSKQLVNGFKMRELIARMVLLYGDGLRGNRLADYPALQAEHLANPARLMGFVLGAIFDFAFNMEYVRRITDNRWSYCTKAGDHRVYYPYLGVCPRCILQVDRPAAAVLGIAREASDGEIESRSRYFGNKIESHHVGRIGERALVYVLDMLTKSAFDGATTLMVFDDQHDVDSVFFFNGLGVLAQIKASPLILLPVVSKLHSPLTDGVSATTGLPEQRLDHTFTGFAAAEHELSLYFSIDDSTLPIGKRGPDSNWPYEPLLSTLNEAAVLKIVQNWVAIYLSFEIPKRSRTSEIAKRAYLTSGWGAPIDDNKTKAGLARSDNMMKGTYASLKYGAYYVQECKRKTLRTALVANIDPVHQYAEYLEKLEDIRWGHNSDFTPSTDAGGANTYSIQASKLTYLFDSVFTFNRQVINDPDVARAWNLESFAASLLSGESAAFLRRWGGIKQ